VNPGVQWLSVDGMKQLWMLSFLGLSDLSLEITLAFFMLF